MTPEYAPEVPGIEDLRAEMREMKTTINTMNVAISLVADHTRVTVEDTSSINAEIQKANEHLLGMKRSFTIQPLREDIARLVTEGQMKAERDQASRNADIAKQARDAVQVSAETLSGAKDLFKATAGEITTALAEHKTHWSDRVFMDGLTLVFSLGLLFISLSINWFLLFSGYRH
jgi:hypothetical protein